jgi:carboxyl-terminal processing protease
MGSKKLQVALPLIIAIAMAAGMFIGYKLREKTSGAAIFFQNAPSSNIGEVVNLIKSKYVDPIEEDSLQALVINDVLKHLDPHSVFIPAKELQSLNEELKGNFKGIGIEFQLINDTTHIISVLKDGPGFKAGLQVGDRILFIDDTIKVSGAQKKADVIRTYIRGSKQNEVKLTVERSGTKKVISIVRGSIPLPSVDAAYLLKPGVGYIKINKFSETTYEEFMQQLEILLAKKMDQLVLDLRGNGGGLMSEAVDIADEFLSNDKLVVYTEGNKSPRYEYRCKRDGLFESGRLVVLIDETSASASEVLSGALQDWDRATIIGRRSFGKGLVQQQYPLSDGGGLRLTIARYYTPLGRNIQKPYGKGANPYEEEVLERVHSGEIYHGSDSSYKKGKAYKTPKGRLVYGGGGIVPDVFVAADSLVPSEPLMQLYRTNIISLSAYRYYMQYQKQLDAYKTPAAFAKSFNGADGYPYVLVAATLENINLNSISDAEYNLINERFKALLARQIWRNEGFYEVLNSKDNTIKTALQFLDKPDSTIP